MDDLGQQINLLDVKFDAVKTLNNLEKVNFPKNVRSLDNLGKAALLLPFGIQESLKSSNIKDFCSENKENSLSDNSSYENQINSIRNNEYKIMMKKKFVRNKNNFFSICNNINDKFTRKMSFGISNIEHKTHTTVNDHFSRKKVNFCLKLQK